MYKKYKLPTYINRIDSLQNHIILHIEILHIDNDSFLTGKIMWGTILCVLKNLWRFEMNNKKIFITDCDQKRLFKLIKDLECYEDCDGECETFIYNLKFKLKCAAIVTPKSVTPTTVTMNSRVRFENLDTGKQSVYTLVFPDDSEISKNKISIMAPMGIALLGHMIGDIIKCNVPRGVSYLKIIAVEYQPEAVGIYQS